MQHSLFGLKRGKTKDDTNLPLSFRNLPESIWLIILQLTNFGADWTLAVASSSIREHLEALVRNLGAPRSTVELPGSMDIFFGNAADTPRNRLSEKSQLLLVVELW